MSEDTQLVSRGTAAPTRVYRVLSRRLCAAPVVFSLFVFFKHRPLFFFFFFSQTSRAFLGEVECANSRGAL